MKTILRLLLLLACLSIAGAAEPAGYYNPASGLTGTPLRTALHNIIKQGHTVIGYTATRTPLEFLDEDPGHTANLILLYEHASSPKSFFVSGNNGGWNREHCWPNSLGIDDVSAAYFDLFNLRACGSISNSDRANLYYDESTTGAGYDNNAGTGYALCTQDSDSWEPPFDMKGDLARSMFYMDIRYEGGSGEPNLALTDNIATITASNANMGRLSTLLIWNFLDPVSPAERTRAERAYGYQNNRNPFVDRPAWVEAIYGEVFKLTAVSNATTFTLSWPAIVPADLGFIEVSTDLIAWIPAALPIVDVAGKHTATVPLTPAPRYYRLKLTSRPG